MKANPDKFQFIILRNTGSHTLQINDITIKPTSPVTLIGITIDLKLNFKEHLDSIIQKAYYKLHTLKVFNIRKSQNLSNFHDRMSVYLLLIDLDV